MKAIVYQQYGPPEVLRYADVAQPTIAGDEVLVQVRAASINFADRAAMRGVPVLGRLAFGLRGPKHTILGRDIAGVVTEVGANVTGFRIGDEVFGEVEQRGFAEYVAAPERHLAKKPVGRHVRAGGDPSGGGDDRGAGSAARPKLSRARRFSSTAPPAGSAPSPFRSRRRSMLRSPPFAAPETPTSCGQSARTMSSTTASRTSREAPADSTSSSTSPAATRSLSFAGRSHPRVSTSPQPAPAARIVGPLPRMFAAFATTPFVRQRLRVLAARRNVADLNHLAELVAAGKVTPVIERTYPLSETADAIRFIEAEHARGKIVLTVP